MAGLPWIQVASDWKSSKKAIRLRVFLQDEWAWAYAVSLWMWTAQHEGDGLIEGPGCVEVIADAAGWKGEPQAFVDALVRAGLLDERSSGFYVHDWHDYAGAHIEKREKERARLRTYRERTGTERVRNAYVPGTNADVHGETERETETETDTQKKHAAEDEPALLPTLPPKPVSPLVAFLRQSFPDIKDPWACEDAWAKAYPAVDLLAESMRALAWETADPKRRKTNHGRFLNSWFGRSQDDASKRPQAPQRRTMAELPKDEDYSGEAPWGKTNAGRA